jgi:opacity protein-like surface antigen
MKKILSVLFLSALSSSALAFEPVRGLVVDVAGGYTPSILAIDGGVSKSGYVGYKFNSIFSLEGGYTSLLTQSKSGTATLTSIAGPEVAGIVRFNINDRVAPFVRVGYTKMALKNSTSGTVTGIENIYGPTYGLGLQFYLSDHLGFRLGYTEYHLQTSSDYNVQSGIPVNTSNYYAALVLEI